MIATRRSSRPGPVAVSPLRAVLRRARTRERSVGDHLYAGYLGVLVVLVVAAPTVRAIWMLLIEPATIALLRSVSVAALPALSLLAMGTALVLGAAAGPAARTPVLTAILADSPLSRVRAFGGPVLRACAVGGAAIGAVAAAWAWPLVGAQVLAVAPAVAWSAVGVLLGVASGTAALAGQRFPRSAPVVGAALILAAVGSSFIPAPPLSAAGEVVWMGAVVAAATLAVVAMSAIPPVLRSLHSSALVSTAHHRERAIDGAVLLDTAAVADATRALPSAGRRRRALGSAARPGRLPLRFLRRDVIAWTRTPGRLAVAVVGLSCAAGLGWLALSVPAAGWLAVPAAVLVYAAAGPFTDGVRLAAEASDAPALTGVSPLALLVLHLVAPVLVWVVAVVIALSLVVAGVVPVSGVLGVVLVGAAALVARVADARKPPLPVAMLAPIVTPFGDMAAANRVLWTLGPVLATAAVGLTATIPGLGLLIVAGLLVHAASRWRTARLRA